MKLQNVIDAVVDNDICIGCGVCAGVCPYGYLEMEWSSQGELVPVIKGCNPSCDLCLRVCPFYEHIENQDDIARQLFDSIQNIKQTPETGYYLNSYIGYSSDPLQRSRGSSGGIASWFIDELFKRNLIDCAICPSPTSDGDDRLFRFKIIHNSEELKDTASSKYYPLEISSVLDFILKEKDDKRYAIIGIPCLIYSISLARQTMPKMRRRVRFLLGLVCGQLPNKFYSELLSLKAGIKLNSIQTINYRSKENTQSATNFRFVPVDKENNKGNEIEWSPYPNNLWQNFYFIHNACNYCDDIFAEDADIVFMDAWLPEYQTDPKGHSLIVVRSHLAQSVIERGIRDKTCTLVPVSIEKVIQSQAGVIFKKRQLIRGKLFSAYLGKEKIPPKRVNMSAAIYFRNFPRIILNKINMKESKRIWLVCRNTSDVSLFESKMRVYDFIGKSIMFMDKVLDRFIRA